MSHPQPTRSNHLLSTLVPGLIGTLLSLLLAMVVWQLEQAEIKDRFERDATHMATSVADAFLDNLAVLYALGALYTSSETVTYNEFHSFTQTLLDTQPSVQALSWVPRISSDRRQTFETAFGTEITELAADGSLIPAASRIAYYPVALVAPLTGNERVLGFDLASARDRQAALGRAGDTGEAAATTRLEPLQGQANGYGVGIYWPLYQQGVPLGTVEQRQEQLLGLLALDLLPALVVETALSSSGLQLLICDDEAAPAGRFLYGLGVREAEGTRRCNAPPASELQLRHALMMAGRPWSLRVTPAPGHYALTASWRPWSLLVLGTLLSALLVRHLQLLNQRAQELRASHHALSEEIRHRKAVEAELHVANRDLSRLADEDTLSGLANRRRFDAVLDREWRQAKRSNAPLSLIFADIDHFKDYNDRYGHAAGDRCLVQVAQQLRSVAERPSDLVARYGGEEFAVILPETPAEGALALAEAMRKAVQACDVFPEGAPAPSQLTISLGVGTYLGAPETSLSTFVEAVDMALYRAKRQGRNRVAEVAAAQDGRSG